MTVLAYGAITRTVSDPRDFGLTPVTRTVLSAISDEPNMMNASDLTVLSRYLGLEGSGNFFCGRISTERHGVGGHGLQQSKGVWMRELDELEDCGRSPYI